MVNRPSMSKLVLLVCTCLGLSAGVFGQSIADINEGYSLFTNISRLWGASSPYFSVKGDISGDLPSDCTITFAQILSRHGARSPTAVALGKYQATMNKINKANLDNLTPEFQFLKTYQMRFEPDALSPFGSQQLINSGVKFFNRYKALAATQEIFVRSTDQKRVVESAGNFSIGYAAAKKGADTNALRPSATAGAELPILRLSQRERSNNTLHHGLCTAFKESPISEIGNAADATFLKTFSDPIVARMNKNLVGANLTAEDTLRLMGLCSFDTLAKPNTTPISPFCNLFTMNEWESYDYLQSVDKWYSFSLGNPLGPTQGVGFTNELIARLTDKAVVDRTSTNITLNRDSKTFPPGLQLYADFTHDGDMISIMSAMGLFNATKDLDRFRRQSLRDTAGFSASTLIPFGARVYVEKMQCKSSTHSEFVRVLVNDRVVPLQNCGADQLGRCKLQSFTDSLSFAKQNGKWAKCFDRTITRNTAKQQNSTVGSMKLSNEGGMIAASVGLVGFVVIWFNVATYFSL